MTNLTPKQQQIYQFIRASTQANGYPPTLREIGQQVGVRSPVHGEVSSGQSPHPGSAPLGRRQDPLHHPAQG